jgi:alkylation response protein AidB-like acyl-CoA dehydrogenase
MALSETDIQRQKEIQQAEELLFTGRQELGFAKGLFLGNFVADWAMPYPQLSDLQQAEVERAVTELREFLDQHLHPEEIDRQADIPREVIDGLGRVGVLGMTAPKEVGGRGFSQMAYCKVLDEIGALQHPAVFTNAHHSIGIRALLLFGTKAAEKWLPKLERRSPPLPSRKRKPGSDAANVRLTKKPARTARISFSTARNATLPTPRSRRS